MSLAIALTLSSPLAASARRVAEAAQAPVAGVAGSRPRTDLFEASGVAPTDEPQTGVTDNSPDDAAVASSAEASSAKEQAEEKPDTKPAGPEGQELTPDERQMVAELQLRDREVRAHEAAHKAAGGAAVGGASYTYQQGPDGRQYAIGGEVPVDLSTGGSPEAVIAKMEQVRAAALAPGDPSPQDHAVAAAADAIAAQARRDLQKSESETAEADQPTADSSAPAADDEAAADSDELVGVGAAGSRQINGRALDAYRRAQDGLFAQGRIDQRA